MFLPSVASPIRLDGEFSAFPATFLKALVHL
jgi:hypothetical protein